MPLIVLSLSQDDMDEQAAHVQSLTTSYAALWDLLRDYQRDTRPETLHTLRLARDNYNFSVALANAFLEHTQAKVAGMYGQLLQLGVRWDTQAKQRAVQNWALAWAEALPLARAEVWPAGWLTPADNQAHLIAQLPAHPQEEL